jgi:hypothetical protein
VRPVGAAPPGPGGFGPQFFWLWAPINFDDACTHLAVNEDAEGRPWHASGSVVQVPQGPIETAASVRHRVRWQAGTRRAAAAEIAVTPHGRDPWTVALEPLLTFQMLGLGYLHPEWGHGMWKGEEAVGGEVLTLADLEPLDPRHLHVQQLCRARSGGREGIGVLEQLILGPHAPSGFRSIIDGAA